MIYPVLNTVPDHRVTGRCIYFIVYLITISLLSNMCGGEDCVDMSLYARTLARDFGHLEGTPDCMILQYVGIHNTEAPIVAVWTEKYVVLLHRCASPMCIPAFTIMLSDECNA